MTINRYIVKVSADGRVEREQFDAADSLGQLQRAVGGYIERVSIPMVRRPDGSGNDLFVNEDGIADKLPVNATLSRMASSRTNHRILFIVGDGVFTAHDGEGEAIGMTEAQCEDIERMLIHHGGVVVEKACK